MAMRWSRRAGDALDDGITTRRRRIADAIGGGELFRRGLRMRGVARMDEAQRRLGGNLRAETGKPGEADGWIDRIGGPAAPAAQCDYRHADPSRVDRRDEARSGRRRRDDDRRDREPLAR